MQLRQLKRGVHVIVGTPGRLMDHMRRGTLKLGGLSTVVLDEADEMLRMGFIEDVEWILSQTPPTRQVALFSATMPGAIRRIAQQYLARSRRSHDQVAHDHRRDDPSALLDRHRRAQARCADAAARNRTVRRHAGVRAHAHRRRRTRRTIAGARLCDVGIERRHAAESSANRPSRGSRPASSTSSSQPTWPRAGSTSSASATSSTSTFRTTPKRTCTASAAPVAPDAAAKRSCSSRRANTICCARSRQPRASRSNRWSCRPPKRSTTNASPNSRSRSPIRSQRATSRFFRDVIVRYQQQHDADPVDIAAALAQLAQGDKPLLVKDVITLDKRAAPRRFAASQRCAPRAQTDEHRAQRR